MTSDEKINIPENSYVYVDHNVLDGLIKHTIEGFRTWLFESPIIPVVSNTNLLEIKISRGYEDEFIALLDQINARFIEEITDDRFRSIDRCRVHETNGVGLKAHMNLVPEEDEGTPAGFGGMIHKLFGGQSATPFREIFKGGLDEIKLENESESPAEGDSEHEAQFKILSDLSFMAAQDAMEQLGELMDSEMKKPENVKFQQYQRSAPRVINNLNGENLIDSVIHAAWGEFDNIEYDVEDLIKQMNQISIETYGSGDSIGDKMRTLYVLLTMFGYQRDPKIKRDAGYRKDMRDMEHMIMSRYCRLFFTRDRRLLKKANPIYRHLNLATRALSPSQYKYIIFEDPK